MQDCVFLLGFVRVDVKYLCIVLVDTFQESWFLFCHNTKTMAFVLSQHKKHGFCVVTTQDPSCCVVSKQEPA